jgi:hypothetical protein
LAQNRPQTCQDTIYSVLQHDDAAYMQLTYCDRTICCMYLFVTRNIWVLKDAFSGDWALLEADLPTPRRSVPLNPL